MHKACLTVPHAYGLERGIESPNKLEQVAKWLVEDGKFLHPNININVSLNFYLLLYLHVCQEMMYDEDKPWQNAIFGDLIKAQWWGHKGNASRRLVSTKENVHVNVPIPLLALVACAVSLLFFYLPNIG